VSRERVNMMFAGAFIVFMVFLVLQKVLHVEDGGTGPVVWWVVAAGKLAGILGLVLFGLWALKLKMSGDRR